MSLREKQKPIDVDALGKEADGDSFDKSDIFVTEEPVEDKIESPSRRSFE